MKLNHDLPPRCNIDEWSDREFLDRFYQVRANSPCTDIAQRAYMLHRLGKISNEDKQLADGFYTICMLPYMDKNFYECMKAADESDPVRVMQKEFVGALNGKKMQQKNELALHKCLSQWGSSLMHLTERNALESDTAKVNHLYREFIDMSHTSTTLIDDNDSRDQVKTKLNSIMEGVCKPYEPPDQSTVSDDQMIEYGQMYTNYGICLTSNLCADRVRNCIESGKSFRECIVFENDTEVAGCTIRLDEAWHGAPQSQ